MRLGFCLRRPRRIPLCTRSEKGEVARHVPPGDSLMNSVSSSARRLRTPFPFAACSWPRCTRKGLVMRLGLGGLSTSYKFSSSSSTNVSNPVWTVVWLRFDSVKLVQREASSGVYQIGKEGIERVLARTGLPSIMTHAIVARGGERGQRRRRVQRKWLDAQRAERRWI